MAERRQPQRLGKPFLSLMDLSPDEIRALLSAAGSYSNHAAAHAGRLKGSQVVFVFTAPSTRTRSAFWKAANHLGCQVLNVGSSDMQTSTGESWSDTGMVFSEYFEAAVVRTNGPQETLRQLATAFPPTINAVTHEEHPSQAVADGCTLLQAFGGLDGLRIAYFGEANNTCRSLAHLVSTSRNASLDVYSPDGYGFEATELLAINNMVGGGNIQQYAHVPARPKAVDVVYTTRWQSMGVDRKVRNWRSDFHPFSVNQDLMARLSGNADAFFMHDLPAIRGEEVEDAVIDSPNSLVREQVRHKVAAGVATLLYACGAL